MGRTRKRAAQVKREAKKDRVERVIRFPGPLYRQLTALANLQERSINGQVLVAVQEQLDRKGK